MQIEYTFKRNKIKASDEVVEPNTHRVDHPGGKTAINVVFLATKAKRETWYFVRSVWRKELSIPAQARRRRKEASVKCKIKFL